MGTNTHYTYPFLAMNHHALMLLMIKKNFKLIQQVSREIGMPIRPLPAELDPDPNMPKSYLFKEPGNSVEVDLKAYIT